jgi:bifunctional non-homologous end joining protein LigD
MAEIKTGRHKVEITHGDKIYFPDAAITKQEVVQYYNDISEYILPHMKERALTMHRFPNGIDGQDFYQHKASDYFPDWIDTKTLKKKEGGEIKHVFCNNKTTLLYLVNQGCIVPHVWLSRVNKPDYPDKMLFDLDPPENDFSLVKKAALKLKKEFEVNLDVTAFVMSTGSRGIHVVIPLDGKSDFDTVRGAAQRVAQKLADENPESFTTEIRKNKRNGKLYLDTTRNAYSQTSVAPYSLRALKDAPVACPMDWEELVNKKFHPQKFSIKNIFKRMGQRDDPWKNFYRSKVKTEKLMKLVQNKYRKTG